MTNPSADAGGQAGDAAKLPGSIGVMDRTSGGALTLSHKRTAVAPDLMRDKAVTFLPESGVERHGQPRRTERKSFRREGLAVSITVSPGNRSKATGEMEVLVDIEGVIGLVECAEAWLATEVVLGALHEGKKEALVALVERLREVGQDDFGQVLDLGDDDAGGIAPVVLALAQRRQGFAGRHPLAGWGGDRCRAAGVAVTSAGRRVLPPFAAEATVGITFRTALLVIAVTHEALEVVLLDPGNDVLGVKRDDVAKVDVGWEASGDALHRCCQEKLECGIVEFAQDAAKLFAAGDGAFGVEAPRRAVGGCEREAKHPDERRVVDKELAELLEGGEVFFQLDQIGSDKGGARRRGGARPDAIGGSFGEMLPVQVAEQGKVLHRLWTIPHGLGQRIDRQVRQLRKGRAGQRNHRWLRTQQAVTQRNHPVRECGKMKHDGLLSGGGWFEH